MKEVSDGLFVVRKFQLSSLEKIFKQTQNEQINKLKNR